MMMRRSLLCSSSFRPPARTGGVLGADVRTQAGGIGAGTVRSGRELPGFRQPTGKDMPAAQLTPYRAEDNKVRYENIHVDIYREQW